MGWRVLFLWSLIALAPAAVVADDAAAYRTLVREMVKAARRSLSDANRFPPANPKLAEEHAGLSREPIVRLLGSRLDADPRIDGYIKEQLLAFEPDIAGAPDREQALIARHLPRMSTIPQPTAPTMRFLLAIEGRVIPEKHFAARVRPVINRFKDARNKVWHANAPARRYHAAVAEQLPADNGLRLVTRLHLEYQCYLAGDWEATTARYKRTRALAAEAQTLWKARAPIPGAIRKSMLTMVDHMHAIGPDRSPRVPLQDIQTDSAGRLVLVYRPRAYPLDGKLYNDLRMFLAGPRP